MLYRYIQFFIFTVHNQNLDVYGYIKVRFYQYKIYQDIHIMNPYPGKMYALCISYVCFVSFLLGEMMTLPPGTS